MKRWRAARYSSTVDRDVPPRRRTTGADGAEIDVSSELSRTLTFQWYLLKHFYQGGSAGIETNRMPAGFLYETKKEK